MWAGVGGPASNGKTLFAGSSGSCGWFSDERPFVSGDGSAVRGERCQRGEVDAALARDRQCGRQADGRLEAAVAQARARMAIGAARRETGSDLTRGGGRAGRAWDAGELWRGVALLQVRGDHV